MTKAVRVWIESIKARGSQVVEDAASMTIDLEQTRKKMQDATKEFNKFQKAIDMPLPIMRALFWTHICIPRLQEIVDARFLA